MLGEDITYVSYYIIRKVTLFQILLYNKTYKLKDNPKT